MLYEIVNGQNLQIQAMYDFLDAKRLPEKDNCNVYVDTIPEKIALKSATSGASAHTTMLLNKMTLIGGSSMMWSLGTLVQM
jgi:hypothetical protein